MVGIFYSIGEEPGWTHVSQNTQRSVLRFHAWLGDRITVRLG